jgi:GNAT superfamily N-acetyltransferase
MDIAIRAANQRDKDEIVRFCTHTFSWGDYIAEVWDIWFREKNGALLVAESGSESIGMGHISLCPNRQGVWLEGVRVRPDRRRSGVASRLLNEMLEYGRKAGAPEALAVVSLENEASRCMIEKSGFESITEWCYFSGGPEIKKPEIASSARIAA